MFTDAELKLLNADNTRYPLIAAAKAEMNACKSCGHGNVNIHTMLRVAVNKYKNDKQFKEHCASLFRLPCSVSGVLIEK